MKLAKIIILVSLIITVLLLFSMCNNIDAFEGSYPDNHDCYDNSQCVSGYCHKNETWKNGKCQQFK